MISGYATIWITLWMVAKNVAMARNGAKPENAAAVGCGYINGVAYF
jgi:hypothetical protein